MEILITDYEMAVHRAALIQIQQRHDSLCCKVTKQGILDGRVKVGLLIC